MAPPIFKIFSSIQIFGRQYEMLEEQDIRGKRIQQEFEQ